MFENMTLKQLRLLCKTYRQHHNIVYSKLRKAVLIKELNKRFEIKDNALYLKEIKPKTEKPVVETKKPETKKPIDGLLLEKIQETKLTEYYINRILSKDLENVKTICENLTIPWMASYYKKYGKFIKNYPDEQRKIYKNVYYNTNKMLKLLPKEIQEQNSILNYKVE